MVCETIGIIGKGFIGKNVFKDLNKQFQCHWVKESQLKEFDILIDCSGNSSKILPEKDPLKDFDLTVKNTLKSATELTFQKYIKISSCEIYTENTKEDSEIDLSKISRYGLSKYLAECIVKKYCKNWIILRLNAPLGKGLYKGALYDAIFGDKLWISPKSKFQVISTNFISEFIKYSIIYNLQNEIFNIAGKDTIELNKLMEIFQRKVPSPDNPIVEHSFNIDKVNKILPVPNCYESTLEFKKEL